MDKSSHSLRLRGNQHGAVLTVGLLLLVVITLLAVSGMNTAMTELALARNDQNIESAFQAAETGLEQALAQSSFSTLTSTTLTQTISPHDSVTASVEFEGTTIVPDRSFSLGAGSGMSAYHFLATARSASRRSQVSDTDRDSNAIYQQAFDTVCQGSATRYVRSSSFRPI